MMQTSEQLTEVREAHRFDEGALDRYLAEYLEGYRGPLRVRQFEGGQSNPTFLLSADSGDYVLRKKPPGVLLPRAHMVEREYRILAALAATDVPVPKVHLLCETPDPIGTPFFIMDYVRGRLLRDPTLPDLKPAERRAIYEEILRVLASLHAVDYEAIGLADYGKPGNYFGRQIRRWSQQYEASKTREIASMDRLMKWLPENIPDDDTSCIVHGDYRLDNLVLAADEARVSAVLDWELSTLGHPLADLAHGCAHYYISIANQPLLADVAGEGVAGGRRRWRGDDDVDARRGNGADRTAGGISVDDASADERDSDRTRVRRDLLPLHGALGRAALELLSRLRDFPLRGHRPGRLQAGTAGQREFAGGHEPRGYRRGRERQGVGNRPAAGDHS